jgi:hypothetical protein
LKQADLQFKTAKSGLIGKHVFHNHHLPLQRVPPSGNMPSHPNPRNILAQNNALGLVRGAKDKIWLPDSG